jgi:hypothetical protein
MHTHAHTRTHTHTPAHTHKPHHEPALPRVDVSLVVADAEATAVLAVERNEGADTVLRQLRGVAAVELVQLPLQTLQLLLRSLEALCVCAGAAGLVALHACLCDPDLRKHKLSDSGII